MRFAHSHLRTESGVAAMQGACLVCGSNLGFSVSFKDTSACYQEELEIKQPTLLLAEEPLSFPSNQIKPQYNIKLTKLFFKSGHN